MAGRALGFGIILMVLVAAVLAQYARLDPKDVDQIRRIEAELQRASHGWLIEDKNGTVYKVERATQGSITYYANRSLVEIDMPLGVRRCAPCASFQQVASPKHPDYTRLAVKFAMQ
jgi:hypothetical protein